MKLHYQHKAADLRAIDPMNAKPLSDRIYDEILVGAQRFTPETAEHYTDAIKLFDDLHAAYENFTKEAGQFGDMFGEYMEGSLDTNQWNGQFFTPMTICDMMTKMSFPIDDLGQRVERICDPACGSGRFMLSIAKHYAQELGYFNFLVVNVDIDKRALTYCTMNAILNMIPSVHIWGDSLGNEVFDGFAVLPGYAHPWIRPAKESLRNLLVMVHEAKASVDAVKLDAPRPAPFKIPSGQATFADLFAKAG